MTTVGSAIERGVTDERPLIAFEIIGYIFTAYHSAADGLLENKYKTPKAIATKNTPAVPKETPLISILPKR